MKVILKKSLERGKSDLGWLKSYFTFSFADYYDQNFMGFEDLRVINEDKVLPNSGFDLHPHSHYNIFSYIVDGTLTHKDSAGNEETVGRNEIQFTRAGTGIYHSEHNYGDKTTHLLQIWLKGSGKVLPKYKVMKFLEQDKLNKLCKIVSKDGDDKTSIQLDYSDAIIYSSVLEKGKSIQYEIGNKNRKLYVHLVMNGGKLKLSSDSLENNDNKSIILSEGDGCFIIITSKETTLLKIEGVNDKSEFVLFDLGSNKST